MEIYLKNFTRMDLGKLKSIDCSNFSVMIVDDIPINSTLLQKFLEPAGFKRIVRYKSSTEAFENIESIMPDLILLDVMMPVLDGITFLKELRENNRFNSIKVIMVSAVSESEEVEKAHSLGADAYITKPVQATLLYKSIAELLETA